jgi:O-antigen/teichoic acid export membrane protein
LESAKTAVPRGTVYIATQGAVSYAVYFLSYVVLTRILTPAEIGKVPLLNATLAVFGAVTSLSLHTGVAKFVSEYTGSGRSGGAAGVVSTAIKLVAVVSIPSFFLVAFFSQQISTFVFGSAEDAPLLNLVVLSSLISDFGVVIVGVLWGMNLFGGMVKSNLAGVLVGRALGVALAWAGLGLVGFVSGSVIGACATLGISAAFARPYLKRNGEDAPPRVLLAYSYPIVFSGLVTLVLNWADVTILYALTGSLVNTGVYYLAFTGASILSPIAGSLTNAVFPTLSARFGRDETQAFKETLRICQRILNILVLPIGFSFAAIAGTAVTVAYGTNYLNSVIPFAILIASAIIPAYQLLMVTTLQAIGKTRPLIRISATAAITEMTLTAALVPWLNVVGSALGRLGMSVVALVVTYRCVKEKWWRGTEKTSLGKSVVLSAVVGILLFVFDASIARISQISPFARLLLDGVLFLILYLGGLAALKPLTADDVELLKAVVPARLQYGVGLIQRLMTAD